MEDINNRKSNEPGKFWQGFLLSIGAWILDSGLATFVFGLTLFNRNLGWEHFWGEFFRIYAPMFFPACIVLAVIWLPIAIVAGFRARNKGIKSLLPLLLIPFIIAPVLFGCGSGFLLGGT